MSVSHTTRTPYQPFQCLICQSRFTRHENLKRHALLHTRSQEASLPCEFCQATFSRPDLRHRHMKRKHPELDQRRERKRVQRDSPGTRPWDKRAQGEKEYFGSPPESPSGVHVQSDEGELELDSNWHVQAESPDFPKISDRTRQPMNEPRIVESGHDVMDLQTLLASGTSFAKPAFDDLNFTQNIRNTLSPFQNDWSPSALQITHGCDLFFTHVSHFVPFLHQPTFNPSRAPSPLILSMLSVAYQYGDDPERSNTQPNSGATLSQRCFHKARNSITSYDETTDSLSTVQSYLLLQLCAMMYLCGSDSSHALKMHSAMISLARSGGLMQPLPVESTVTQDLDTLWREFIKAESHKRTVFAVHQIDALWYQFLSIPRSISHLEVKHNLPCPQDHWTASSPAEWAHRQLVARQAPAVQYVDAVRRILSQDTDLPSISPFDSYGAINIAQFLISSAREISGWSTMTGMLSIDRFGALRSSLIALSPFISPPGPTSQTRLAKTSALPTATWQTAMIELQIWSPSHTSGIVEASLDAVLTQSTYLAPSRDILCEDITAKAIQPHVDWFLRYLDTTVNPEGEAPWIALYAYKTFLIAWQLVRGRLPGAMAAVGVEDGDVEGALVWARTVFRRRERWTLGRLIVACLDGLATNSPFS